MQFLPWSRRGLAAELSKVDSGAALPARAAFGVDVTVNGSTAHVDIDTYGPGDVTGLDVSVIARTAPRRYASNVAPDEFAAIEFTVPDLPWMFTPAVAGTDQRLRPWLVLVVVTKREGIGIAVDRTRPLPVLTIEAPAVPADELPDLEQSWAWAHTQVITADRSDDPVAALSGPAERRLARLVCPRRLVPGTGYLAALVPAFDLGVEAGFGRPSRSGDIGPAWSRSSLGERIELPVYFHWEFSTGPAGDFESLARRLRPMTVPDGVGAAPMYIGAAHPALPPLAPDAGGVVSMEGALRAPGPDTHLDPRTSAFTDALVTMVNATAPAVTDGSASDAESVAPPIYGQWNVNVHQIPAGTARPRWLRDLNADPRMRVAAGLGAEVVRAFQEEYVDAAWKQVGDVLAANRLLELARAMAAVAERLHARHILPLEPVRLVPFAGVSLDRMLLEGASIGDVVRRSASLPGFETRNLRRIGAPRSTVLRAAVRRGHLDARDVSNADIGSFTALASGAAAPLIAATPDGIATTALPALVRDIAVSNGNELVEALARRLGERLSELDGRGMPAMSPRTDLGRVGVITDREIDRLRRTVALDTDLIEQVHQLRACSLEAGPETIGVLAGPNGVVPIVLDAAGTVSVSVNGAPIDLTAAVGGPVQLPPGPIAQPGPGPIVIPGPLPGPIPLPGPFPGPIGVPGPFPGPIGVPGPFPGPIAGPFAPIDRSGLGMFDSPLVGPVIDRPLRSATDVLDVLRDSLTRGTVSVPELGDDGEGLTAFELPSTAFAELQLYVGAHKDVVGALAELDGLTIEPEPAPPLDLDRVADAIRRATAPRPVVERRLADRVRAGDHSLAAATPGRVGLYQPDPIQPILVGPVLERPLYLDLARFDQARFLPGASAIPEDSITSLETNQRFVEAFLVGANHELNRELLWRRYPTDRRGTPFRRFWDRLPVDGVVPDDIEPIHTWQGVQRLGTNARGDTDGCVVLVVRGQLLRRYPNTVVYAVAATPKRRIDPSARPRQPAFAGFLEPDIAFVGFDFDTKAAAAGDGTMFVLQEQPSEPRFGLDAPVGAVAVGPPGSWSDLTWGHVGTEPGRYLDVTVFPTLPERPLASDQPTVTARFGADAGHLAAIWFQRPFRAAIHSSEILA